MIVVSLFKGGVAIRKTGRLDLDPCRHAVQTRVSMRPGQHKLIVECLGIGEVSCSSSATASVVWLRRHLECHKLTETSAVSWLAAASAASDRVACWQCTCVVLLQQM